MDRITDELIEYFTFLRKKEGVSQEKLAELSELKQPAIARMEAKRATPTLTTFVQLLDSLGYELVIVPKRK